MYETQGTGKNKTQRLVIYYKFVGYLDIDPTQCHLSYTADIREDVAIEPVSCEPSDSLKELFSEGYNANDDSFEGAENGAGVTPLRIRAEMTGNGSCIGRYCFPTDPACDVSLVRFLAESWRSHPAACPFGQRGEFTRHPDDSVVNDS